MQWGVGWGGVVGVGRVTWSRRGERAFIGITVVGGWVGLYVLNGSGRLGEES